MRRFLWDVFRIGQDPMIVALVEAHITDLIEIVKRGGAWGISQAALNNIAWRSSMEATLLDRGQVALRVTGNLAAAYAPVLDSVRPSHPDVKLRDVKYDRNTKTLTATLDFLKLIRSFQEKAPE